MTLYNAVLFREATVADRKTLFEPVVQMVSKMTQPPSKFSVVVLVFFYSLHLINNKIDLKPIVSIQLPTFFQTSPSLLHLRQKPPVLVAKLVSGQYRALTKLGYLSG